VETIDISVNLCTYNRFEMLRQTLDSLLKQEPSGPFSYEIVVVDDGSTDETPLFVQEMIRVSPVPVRYVREERVGVAAARNRGVKESRGKWIAFIDDDEIAEPDWLQELIIAATATGADCVGGAVKAVFSGVTDERVTATLRKHFGETPHLGWFKRRFTYPGPGTGNALVRRILFEKIGLFDVSLKVRGEDQDFFRRARKAGYRIVFTSKAIIYHITPSSRLSPHYILDLAQQVGKNIAFLDCKEWGCLKAALVCGMRIAHTGLKAGNVAIKYVLRHDRSSVFDLKCSIYSTTAYCGEILSQIRKR
jgi:glycosyltransferase involved in cell wall biosynthesis